MAWYRRVAELVRVLGEADPQVVVQQGVELGGDEPHLRRQLRDLLADEHRSLGQLGVQEHDRLAERQAGLGAAEADHVDPGVDGEAAQGLDRAAERSRGVGDAGAVEVHGHAHAVGGVAQRGDLVGGVQRCPARCSG